MSLQESRRLWCFLEGDSKLKPYYIFDIPINANVDLLRVAIKKRIGCLRDIDADCLQLRKVVSLIPGIIVSRSD
ncbi:hypothetical protein M378DRAFT_162472 [Amanita muscaria Koide BX008]|uniref:Crinkler effector protein N-terminal domain-containing protein n=1 Tax=Amanita muscaria (strain Koide BX008) TaxID=946122 RepID=A0A0C2X7C9_AMAMK|nr:hypothetical protein M378DRAFT_162472 [Amanita muscaria Koide BX008]